MISRVVAITGIPGSGKTELAKAVAEHFGAELVTSHDLVEACDPEALTEGRMADMDKMGTLFKHVMQHMKDETVVIDGWPRTKEQAMLLPEGTLTILLTCRIDIAADRLMRRGRADDTPALIRKRLEEQSAQFMPWAFELAEWERTINTSTLTQEWITERVFGYLDGTRRDMH